MREENQEDVVVPDVPEEQDYVRIPYKFYNTLEEKLDALLAGETLHLFDFSKGGDDVLVRLVRNKFTSSQISFNLSETEQSPRHWVTYNVGLNDLSFITAIKYEEELAEYSPKYRINDFVLLFREDGKREAAIIEEVYVSLRDPNQYAYRLSYDSERLYKEEDLYPENYECR